MMKVFARSACAAVALGSGLGVAGQARAADMDLPPIYETQIYSEVPEVVPVEIGTGWYLRGDVGYGFERETDFTYDVFENNGLNRTNIFNGEFEDIRTDGAFQVGIGAGYQFTDFFRADATLNYWKEDLDAVGNGVLSMEPSAEIFEAMGNVYVDLGTFVGLTPYVGAGVGAVHVEYDPDCLYGTLSCESVPGLSYEGGADWRFAYSLMAGLSYDMSKNLKLDIGYKYLDAEGGEAATASYYTTSPTGPTTEIVAEDDGFTRHSITAGIRYSLW